MSERDQLAERIYDHANLGSNDGWFVAQFLCDKIADYILNARPEKADTTLTYEDLSDMTKYGSCDSAENGSFNEAIDLWTSNMLKGSNDGD